MTCITQQCLCHNNRIGFFKGFRHGTPLHLGQQTGPPISPRQYLQMAGRISHGHWAGNMRPDLQAR